MISGAEARRKILQGIREAKHVVSITYGPRGRTVAYTKGRESKNSKDGITVIKQLEDDDELIDMGIKFVKDTSDRCNHESGDGSTSSAIMAASLCEAANKCLIDGININDLRYGFNKAEEIVSKKVDEYRRTVESEEDMEHVANVSSNGDPEITTNILKAFTLIGDNGRVAVLSSASKNGKTEVILKQGLSFNKGYISSKCKNSENNKCVFEDPIFILTKEPIDSPEFWSQQLEYAEKHNQKVVIIAPLFDDEFKAFYLEHCSSFCVCIEAPGGSQDTVENYIKDYSVLLGAKIIGEDVHSIEEFDIKKDVGHAESITVDPESTTITGPKTDKNALDKHIAELKKRMNSSTAEKALSQYEIDNINQRIAFMTGGIATIYVGALTAPELEEKKERYDDAVHALRRALTEGYVLGGGTSLLRISYECCKEDYCKDLTPPQKIAYRAYMKALREPCKTLIDSADGDAEEIIPAILQDKNNGFNARTCKVEDFEKAGIFDPFLVIKNSVLFSSSTARQFMSIDSAIVSDLKNFKAHALDPEIDDGRGVSFE